MQKMSTCLWFDTEAEEAAKFYTSVFKDGKIGKVLYYGEEGFEIHGKPAGSIMVSRTFIQCINYAAIGKPY